MATEGRGGEFIVDTMGRCFFCTNKIRMDEEEEEITSLSKVKKTFSFQYASNYLKLNKVKVGVGVGGKKLPGPSNTPNKTNSQQQTMKVELCANCEKLNDKFSKMYEQLEKIQMEMTSCLKEIYGKMMGVEISGKDFEDDWMAGLKVNFAQGVRKRVVDECAHKLKSSLPRVQLRKLTEEERLKWAKINSSVPPEAPSTSGSSQAYENHKGTRPEVLIDIDKGADVDSADEEGKRRRTEGSLDDDGSEATPPPPLTFSANVSSDSNLENSTKLNDASTSTIARDQKKASVVQKSKNVVVRQFATKRTARNRINVSCIKKENEQNRISGLPTTVSMRKSKKENKRKPIAKDRRFSCRRCGKVYNHACSLYTHVRVAHLKHRYSCDICDTSYNNPSALHLHRKFVHLGVARKPFSCNLCEKTFRDTFFLKVHLQKVHSVESADCSKFKCWKCQKTFCNLRKHIMRKKSCKPKPAIKKEIKLEEEEMD